MLLLGLKFNISAAHRIKWHNECSKLHGHNYVIEVYVSGDIDKEKGVVIDFKELREIVWSVIKKYDHIYLNNVIGDNATVELFALKLREELENVLKNTGLFLYKLKIYETENEWIEWIVDENR